MKICKHCSTQYPDNAQFCPSCGAPSAKISCNSCGYEFETGNYCPKCGVRVGTEKKICPKCRTEYYTKACPECGYIPTGNVNGYANVHGNEGSQEIRYVERVVVQGATRKECSKTTAFLLCFFLGFFGFHKFYEGKVGMGILYLFTGALCGIGWFVDLIVILTKPSVYYVE